jgi:nucleoside-diphosphate-sugar epimerase
MVNPLVEDLDHILSHTEKIWEEFRSQHIFITGGTGFFGCWLLESFAWANDRLGLNASALVLTRNTEGLREKAPHLAVNPAIHFHVGNVENFEFPVGNFSHIVHASNEALNYVNERNCRLMTNHMIEAAKHVLDFAGFCGAEKFLFTSSGTVYGPQPPNMIHMPEDYMGSRNIDDFRFAHGEGKYRAEILCGEYAEQYNMEAKIARCFSFLGPYMPLNEHYAIGNFIRDGIQGGPILVNGDGTPVRSYLYASDLLIWLLTILVQGKSCEPYNVGSEVETDIRTAAMTVAKCFETAREVRIAIKPTVGRPVERYVPSTEKSSTELGLRQYVGFSEGIRKTVLWHEKRGQKRENDPFKRRDN